MIKKTHVYTTVIEKEVFDKYDVSGRIVEVPAGDPKPAENARLIGRRSDANKVRYRVPLDVFLEIAERT